MENELPQKKKSMENKITPSASFYARPGRAVGNPDCSPVTVPDHIPWAATMNLRNPAEMLQEELQRLTLRSSSTRSPIRQVASTSPGLVANPYTLFPDWDSKKGEEPILYRDMARTRGLNYGYPCNPSASSYARPGCAVRNPYCSPITVPDHVPSATTMNLRTPAEMRQAELQHLTLRSSSTRSPIRKVASTSPGLVANPNNLFPDSDSKKGEEPIVYRDMAQISGLNYGSPNNSLVCPGYASPYYCYGDSSNAWPSYSYQNHGDLESPYGFCPNSINVGNVGYGNGGFSPNSINVGNLGYNFGGSYSMYQDYQPTSPYGGAVRGGPYFNRGVNPTEQANEESDHTAWLLEFITSRAARFELERHNYGDAFVCNLARCISRNREVLATAAEDVDGVEFLMVLVDAVEPCRDLCKRIVSALEPKAFELMMHPTSYKLVLHCIAKLKNGQNKSCLQSLLAEATKGSLKLARSDHGKVFLKGCIKHLGYPDNRRIVERLAKHSVSLAKHSKGNYVVQAVLQLGVPQFSRSVCRALKDQLEELSTDQHGSYVVQQALASAGGKILLEELASFEEDRLETLATDRYGNYILQTALEESKKKKHDELHGALVSAIKRLPEELKDHTYASKVLRLIILTQAKC